MLKGKKVNLSDIRRHLHANPELSGVEETTAQYICDQLERIGVDRVVRNVGGASVLAEIGPSNASSCFLVRAELDALPIEEENGFIYKSRVDGVSHKCGHDGHMTIVLGLAQKLLSIPLSDSKILLLFQTAEEIGVGAKSVIESGELDRYNIDAAIALHNIPDKPINQILSKAGAFTPSVLSVKYKLKGKETHAAKPNSGLNPSYLIADIIKYSLDHQLADSTSDDFVLYTPIEISAGQNAYGTAAGNGVIGFTMRAWDNAMLLEHLENFKTYVEKRAVGYGIALEFDVFDEFEANTNDKHLYEVLVKACDNVGCDLSELEKPFSWGEDFGAFSKVAPTLMFGLGAGEECPDLHNPDYDFPDEIIPTGVNVFYQIIKELNNKA